MARHDGIRIAGGYTLDRIAHTLSSHRWWLVMRSRVAMQARPAASAVIVGESSENSAQVAWFESEHPLRVTGAAMGSAGLFAALHLGLDLEIESDADAEWVTNAGRASALLAEWWGYRPAAIRAIGRAEPRTPAEATALCFTGGVDSFHNLLFGGRAIDYLLFVQGYDVPLGDLARLDGIERDLVAIADATGTRPILVRTNYREVPILGQPSWEQTHGSALAAVGHLLVDSVGTLLISATDHQSVERAWGSSWKLDPLWSSSNLAIVHQGAELRRYEKVVSLGESSLARRYLRVCWQHLDSRPNCGRCEKCLRTQVMLAQSGQLPGFAAFPQDSPLEDRIDALPPLSGDVLHHWSFVSSSIPTAIEPAVRRLLARSQPPRSMRAAVLPWSWVRRLRSRPKPRNC